MVGWLPENILLKHLAGWEVNSKKFIADQWQSVTPWLSAASCSAVASHTGFRLAAALRAVTIQLTSLPSVAGRGLSPTPVIMGRYMLIAFKPAKSPS